MGQTSTGTGTEINQVNPGIGTTTPYTLLHVAGNATVNGTLFVDGYNVTGRQISDNTTLKNYADSRDSSKMNLTSLACETKTCGTDGYCDLHRCLHYDRCILRGERLSGQCHQALQHNNQY